MRYVVQTSPHRLKLVPQASACGAENREVVRELAIGTPYLAGGVGSQLGEQQFQPRESSSGMRLQKHISFLATIHNFGIFSRLLTRAAGSSTQNWARGHA